MRTTIQVFNRQIGPVSLDVVVSEKHAFEIGITSNPIETGAEVNDHAYIMPNKLTLDVAGSNATAVLNSLVAFQRTRVPFTVVSGWFVYNNMLIKSINADRDETFSNVLRATVDLQEVIIVGTAYAAGENGNPTGGGKTQKAAGQSRTPAPQRSGDAATKARTSGTVQRGDTPATTVPPARSQSLLRSLITGG